MKKLEVSQNCYVEKDSEAITRELMKGSFIIACDINKDGQTVLQNVFHYTANQDRIEYYSLFPDAKNERRLLRLEFAVMIVNKADIFNSIKDFIDAGYQQFDVFIIDKYNNLYTKTVYDKYGGSMQLG